MNDEDLMKEVLTAKAVLEAEESGDPVKVEAVKAELTKAEQSDNTTSSVDPFLEQAIKEGYNPNYDGVDKKTPEQFVKDGSFFKKINAQKKDIDELKQAINELAIQSKKAEELGRQKAIDELKAMRNQAIEEGDVVKVNALDDHIEQERSKMRPQEEQQQTTSEVHQAALAFKEKNSTWLFNYDQSKPVEALSQEEKENKEMTEMALIYDDYLGRNKVDGEEAMRLVQERIQKHYSHRFDNPKRDEPLAVGKPTPPQEKGSSDNLVARMTQRQKDVYGLVSQNSPGTFGTIEDYAKQLDKIGELKND